jgi:hypothetical protein
MLLGGGPPEMNLSIVLETMTIEGLLSAHFSSKICGGEEGFL